MLRWQDIRFNVVWIARPDLSSRLGCENLGSQLKLKQLSFSQTYIHTFICYTAVNVEQTTHFLVKQSNCQPAPLTNLSHVHTTLLNQTSGTVAQWSQRKRCVAQTVKLLQLSQNWPLWICWLISSLSEIRLLN